MIALSVDTINQRAPYKLEQTGDTSFMFETKHGVVYSAGFMQDVSFLSEGVYQFYLVNLSGKTIGRDDDISETVRVVIEEFFTHKEVVMLYICDTADGRQASRDRSDHRKAACQRRQAVARRRGGKGHQVGT